VREATLKVKSAILGILVALVSVCAEAAPITYSYSVQVEHIVSSRPGSYEWLPAVEHPYGGSVQIGDTFTGQFTLDQDNLQLDPAMQQPVARYFWNANGAGIEFSYVTADGATYHSKNSPDSGSVQIVRNNGDMFGVSSYDQAVVSSMVFANWSRDIFSSFDIPEQMKLADFEYKRFNTSWKNNGVEFDVIGVVSALERVRDANTVPEPCSWLLLAAGELALARARRKSALP
jgi:hypothetical protein